MSRNYTGLGRYEELFDQLDAAISRLESRCDKIERRVTNLPAQTYVQQASRMDIADRCIDNLCPPIQPEPKPPYVSRRWDPPDRRPRTGYPPIGYRDRAQDARPRHRGGYSERDHLFDRGDQRIQLGFDRHPIHATQPHRPTSWDPPTQQQDHSYPAFDHRPRRAETYWDRPHHQEEVRAPRGQSACHQPRHTADQPPRLSLWPRDLYCQSPRVTNQTPYQPSRSPTCWEPPGLRTQQGYPADDISFERFGSDDLCWGRRSSLSLNRYIECSMSSPATKKKATPGFCSLGSRCEPDYQVSVGLREQEGYETSDSSSLDEKIAYSCVEARVFDCVYDRGTCEEELGDFEDSVLETAAKKTKDRDADSSDTESVSNVAIRLPSENHGSREGRDDRPEDQRVSSFVEIYLPRSPDMSKVNEEEALLDDVEEDDSTVEVPKVIASFTVVQVQSKSIVENCWGKKGDGAYTGLRIIAGVYVDLNISDVTSMNHRSTSLDTDARLIPPGNDTLDLNILGGVDKLVVVAWNFADHIGSPLLVFYGCDKGRYSVVRYVFDSGGDALPKLLLSTLVVALWFPP